MPPLSRLHAMGVKAALSGLAVVDGHREHDPPCVVFYDLDGGQIDGPLADPDRDVVYPFQLTCVGISAAAARKVADDARAALPNVVIEGRRVMRLEPDGGLGGVKSDDDTADPTLFYLTPKWRLWTTPA